MLIGKAQHMMCKMKLTIGFICFMLIRSIFGYESLAILEEEGSTRLLSRHRRFLIPTSTNWRFTMRLSLKVPLEGLSTSMTANVPFPYSFDLPSLGRKKRDISRHISDSELALKKLEIFLPSVVSFPDGVTSHDCILRAICEVASTPTNDEGLMGDMVNLLLTPSHVLDSTSVESDYLDAQRIGHFFKNCTQFEEQCPYTLFECFDDTDGSIAQYLPTFNEESD